MHSAEAIRFEDVVKRYGEGPPALDGISLSVHAREFLVIVGGSGSGKTTLLRLINRISEPTSGSLFIDEAEASSLDPIELRRGIGYVFQEIGLFPHMTVEENIAITPRLLGWDAARIAARVEELLKLTHLDLSYRTRFPRELSGGERQRVGVARALAVRPGIVLMDEPFAALDPLTRESLVEDYRRLHDELELTTVMITHDMLEAVSLADRIVVLRDGHILADGKPAALTESSDPYVRELMQAPRRHVERLSAVFKRGNGL
jgi:osmoprotectant transport system ATP-binding protein